MNWLPPNSSSSPIATNAATSRSSQYCCDTKRGGKTDTLQIELVSATAGCVESLGGADCRDQGGPGVSARSTSQRSPAVEPMPVVDGGWRLGDAAAMVLDSRIRATFRVDGHTK